MSKVVVVADASLKPLTKKPCARHKQQPSGCIPDRHQQQQDTYLHKYECWVPLDYSVTQLTQDVVRYWHLPPSKLYQLHVASIHQPLAGEWRLDFLSARDDEDNNENVMSGEPTMFTLKKAQRTCDDQRLLKSSPAIRPATWALDSVSFAPSSPAAAAITETTHPLNTVDPFWIQEKLFELFLFYALQNMTGKAPLWITCYQFKSLLQKATNAKTGTSTSKCSNTTKKKPTGHKLGFDTRVLLAFKGAVPNSSGGAGATFDEFLDALVDVASFMFGKLLSSKELAFEMLTTKFVIPQYERERYSGGVSALSWTQMDALVTTQCLNALIARFAKPIGDLAASFSSTIGGARYYRGLQFHEFTKFIFDIKPKSFAVNGNELCDVFIRCCKMELREQYSDTTTLASLYFSNSGNNSSLTHSSTSSFDNRSKSMARRTGNAGGNFTTHGGNTSNSSNAMTECGGALEILCGKMMSAFAYLALITMPPLAKMKDQLYKANFAVMTQFNNSNSNLLGTWSAKALLHHIANHLSTKNAGHAKKSDAAFALARGQFLHEFQKMHQEDAMADYLSELSLEIRALLVKHEAATREVVREAQSNTIPGERGLKNDDESSVSQEKLQANEGFDFSLDWGNGDDVDEDEGSEVDDKLTSEADSTDDRLLISTDPELLKAIRQRELEELTAVLNEGDEIYSFLASELQRHALLDKRIDDTDTVSQMLDMWVTAGQKYAQVISHVEVTMKSPTVASEFPSVKAAFLQRFGCSLYVFARQLLTSTTKVYAYEEFFAITNARVYGVQSAFWDDSVSVFTTDLAMETLSLASGKLALACTEFMDELGLELDGDGSNDHHVDVGDGGATVNSRNACTAIYERYLECLFHRAACLSAYGDLLAHNTRCARDYELGCLLEEELEGVHTNGRTTPGDSDKQLWEEYHSISVLSKASPPGQFYREANRICRYIATRSPQGTARCSLFQVHHELSMTQFKLATHLPRGCVAEKKLLEEALVNLAICQELQRNSTLQAEPGTLIQKKEYISAILVLRHKFFQPEGLPHSSTAKDQDRRQQQQHSSDEDLIAPFYRFVLAAAFRDFDEAKAGVLSRQNLSQLNKACGRGEVSESAMQWLLLNFDHQGHALTERGLLQYFCWIAEADPLAFCEILDIFTSKYTETHHASITTSRPSHISKEPKAKSLRSILFAERRQQTARSSVKERPVVLNKKGIAECVVVLSGKMTAETCGDLSQTRSPSDIRLEPEVIDVLPSNASLPDELSKFCFPDDVFLYNEPLPPKTFDIVLTDIKGDRLYGSCLHFYEEKDPMDVLALISGVQKGRTASLPSWISLRDIQQHKTQWRCFVPKCLCVLSSYPLFQTFREFLAQLYRLSMSGPGGASMLESFVFNFVEEIPLPANNLVQSSFRLVDRACLLTGNAPGLPALYPTEVDFTILFQCLSPENILKVYAFLLTEKKVVVCSSNYSIITPVTETLRALLHPFECQVVYIPVLPLSLLDFVSAPVPFFMGVRSDKRVESLVSEGIVVVDLDKSEVLLPPNELMPSLPDVKAKKLLQALRKVSYWASNQKSKDGFGRFQEGELLPISASFEQLDRLASDISPLARRHDELIEKWSELQALFSGFATRLLKDFRKYCSKVSPTSAGSDETITFDKRGFLSMHPSLREFCTQLFQTQLFQRFIERSAVDGATSGVEQEVSWLSARSKSVIWKSEPTEDAAAKAPPRQVVRVPSPFKTNRDCQHKTLSSQRRVSLSAVDAFPTFNAHAYEELLSRTTTTTAAKSRISNITPRITTSPVSSKASLSFHNDDSPASKLVSAARQRLEVPVLD